MAGAFIVLWMVSLWFLARNIGARAFELTEILLESLAIAVPSAAWIGYYGLTREIRGHWREITSAGPAWPSAVEYPGPRRAVVSSFFIGKLPGFIVGKQDRS
jgi:hypothetical protein